MDDSLSLYIQILTEFHKRWVKILPITTHHLNNIGRFNLEDE